MLIKYSEKAVRQIHKISKGDKRGASAIMEAIEAYTRSPKGKFDVKLLRGNYGDLKGLRTGKYRVVFELIDEEMLIYEIKHRQEAYHD